LLQQSPKVSFEGLGGPHLTWGNLWTVGSCRIC